ncbi:hypothetical protein WN943_007228 [Citrus x changshan-huyou]
MGKRRGRGSRNRGTWRKSGTQAFEDCGASRKGILRLAARFVIQKRAIVSMVIIRMEAGGMRKPYTKP